MCIRDSAEGAQIHYEENVDLIPEACKDKESTLVIYTPDVYKRQPTNWQRKVKRYY